MILAMVIFVLFALFATNCTTSQVVLLRGTTDIEIIKMVQQVTTETPTTSTIRSFVELPPPVFLDVETRDCYPQWNRDTTIECIVFDTALEWGIDVETFGRVAECESGFKAAAENPGSSATGVMQFLTGTWNWISTLGAPHPYGDRFDPVQNVENAAFLWTTDSPTHWVCY